MQIIDSHVHFWQPGQLHYRWLDDFAELNRPFLPADFSANATQYEIAGMVFVQADCLPEQGASEVEWVAELASAVPIKCIVAFAALEEGDAARHDLEALADNSLVCGIRRLVQSEADVFATQQSFIKNVRVLPNYGLTFDICVYQKQLPDVITLVGQCPDTRFVLDHLGKPDAVAGTIEPWARDIRTLAEYPNVWCKLSGLVTQANLANWKIDDLQPYANLVIENFGVERVMFGSDWPVCTLAVTYDQWLETALELTTALTSTDQQSIFFDNAQRFYGFNV